MITIRNPETIYQTSGQIKNGTFHGRWHFSFDQYYDPEYTHFGTLRVFNDDTLSPGAVWPLHPHRDNEVVTYCAGGVPSRGRARERWNTQDGLGTAYHRGEGYVAFRDL